MTKKTFENPAMNYITAAQEPEHTTVISNTEKAHKGRKTDGTAKKDYRLNLLIPRELRETLQILADFDRRSLNALINDALAAYAADREADYQTYTAFLKKIADAQQK